MWSHSHVMWFWESSYSQLIWFQNADVFGQSLLCSQFATLRAADHFGAWLLKQGMVVTDISTSTVDRYLEGLGRQFFSVLPTRSSASQGIRLTAASGDLDPTRCV